MLPKDLVWGQPADNSFLSGKFDVLIVNGSEDPLVDITKLTDFDLEESYFSQAVTFINAASVEYTNAKKKLYTNIAESTDLVSVTESYSDFYVKAKAVIDKFLKFNKQMNDKHIQECIRNIQSDKTLSQKKKELNDFKGHFQINGFNYTFTDTIPDPNVAYDFMNSYFDKLYSKCNNALTIEAIEAAINSIQLEEDYKIFRAKVLGDYHGSIGITEFPSALFKVFRNGKLDPEYINATDSYVKATVERYFNTSEMRKSIERGYTTMKKSYESIEKQLKTMTNNHNGVNFDAFVPNRYKDIKLEDPESIGINLSAEFMTKMDIYTKAKIDQLIGYSNIHTLAYSAKLDAYRECMIQDKNTLYTALMIMNNSPKENDDTLEL